MAVVWCARCLPIGVGRTVSDAAVVHEVVERMWKRCSGNYLSCDLRLWITSRHDNDSWSTLVGGAGLHAGTVVRGAAATAAAGGGTKFPGVDRADSLCRSRAPAAARGAESVLPRLGIALLSVDDCRYD